MVIGWYLLSLQMLRTVGFQLPLPVGDFSRFWDKKKKNSSRGSDGSEGSDVDA